MTLVLSKVVTDGQGDTHEAVYSDPDDTIIFDVRDKDNYFHHLETEARHMDERAFQKGCQKVVTHTIWLDMDSRKIIGWESHTALNPDF